MARVRYMVDDVVEAIDFYTSKLGFELQQKFGSAFAIVANAISSCCSLDRERPPANRCPMERFRVLEAAGPDS